MIKTALVGYGLAGKVFHAPLIQAAKQLDLTGVMSSREEEIRKSYPECAVYSGFEEVLDSEAQLVVIASPNDTHYELAKRALSAGKHVVVDKPMTPSLSQAKELLELAKSKSLELAVFHNRRLDGDFMTAKKILKEGKIGTPYYFESNFHRFRPSVNTANWRETTKTAGGIFFDLAPHLLDQAINLFGIPERAFADIEVQREDAVNDDNFHIVLFYGKCRAHLNASVLYKAPFARFILNGDKGSFVKKGMDPQESRLKESGYFEGVGADEPRNYGTLHSGDPDQKDEREVETIDGDYLKFYENVGQKILGKTSELLVKPEEAILVMELLEALATGSRERRFVEKGKDYDLA